MKAIAVSELRANLMKIIKEIERGSSIDITSRGKVVAKLVPPGDHRKKVRQRLRRIGKTAEINDIISPVDVEWKAQKE